MSEERKPQPLRFSVPDMVTMTARLAQVLAEEVDLLRGMKVSKIEALQQEKLFLTNALEAYRKLLDKHPELKTKMTEQEKRDLAEVSQVFNNVLKENHKRLMMAREVNHRVVQAIRSCVNEQNGHSVYNRNGYNFVPGSQTLSVTLNRQI